MAVQPGLCRTWSETPKTGFITTRLNYILLLPLPVVRTDKAFDKLSCQLSSMYGFELAKSKAQRGILSVFNTVKMAKRMY